MRTSKTGMLAIITLIGVMIFTGSAHAMVTVTGQVNATDADDPVNYVTVWLDINPSDYATKFVQDMDPYVDYYWFDDLDPMLTRNGYIEDSSFDIPITVAMFCEGELRDINENPGGPYNNGYRNVTFVHTTIDFVHATYGVMDPVEPIICADEKPFSKTLYVGWNLISLPLTPGDNSTSSVLASVWDNVDAVYGYNAETKQFESVSAMDLGEGYFVHATAGCTWEYSGTPYTSMSTSLEPGLNMVGWLNSSKDVGDALSSVSGDYYYVARWNTSAEKFEVYNPAAPSAFKDFTTMDRGTGYFISAKQECALSESC